MIVIPLLIVFVLLFLSGLPIGSVVVIVLGSVGAGVAVVAVLQKQANNDAHNPRRYSPSLRKEHPEYFQ